MYGSNDIILTEELINDLLRKKKAIEKLLKELNTNIDKAPAGSLRISKSRNTFQYFLKSIPNEAPGKYLHYEERDLAVRLAQQDYDIRMVKVLEDQLKAINTFLKNYDSDAAAKTYESLNQPRKELVTPAFLTDEAYVNNWLAEEYEHKGFEEGESEHYTARGERVRSKSEVMIADALLRYNIPYQYEYPIYISGLGLVHPDFRCLNKRLRKVYYWEHNGRMGKEDYSNRAVKRIEKYTLDKDFDESMLILTFETDAYPLNTRVIESMIKRYLL